MADPSPSLLLARATRQLTTAGIETPAADARMLLCEALRIQPSQLIRVASVNADDEDRFNQMVDRRRSGEPAQYIIGHAWFRGLRLGRARSVYTPLGDRVGGRTVHPGGSTIGDVRRLP